jgi:Tol biopolymer transport system component
MGVQADSSPEGNEIIVSFHVTRDVHGSIWVVHADGTGLHEVTSKGSTAAPATRIPTASDATDLGGSPDDKEIIFAADSPAAGTNIHTANADGTGLTQVTFDGSDDDPD